MKLYSFYYLQKKKNVFNIYVRKKEKLIDQIGTFIKKKKKLIIIINDFKLNFWLNQGLFISNIFIDQLIDRYLICRIKYLFY